MKILLHTIPHSKQRYPTAGDWIVRGKNLKEVRVSHTNNEEYAFLTAIHELIEAHLCLKRGISQKSVDDFDKYYEKNRSIGDYSEPGDQVDSPYFKEHRFATKIEKMLARELGVDWNEYGKALESL